MFICTILRAYCFGIRIHTWNTFATPPRRITLYPSRSRSKTTSSSTSRTTSITSSPSHSPETERKYRAPSEYCIQIDEDQCTDSRPDATVNIDTMPSKTQVDVLQAITPTHSIDDISTMVCTTSTPIPEDSFRSFLSVVLKSPQPGETDDVIDCSVHFASDVTGGEEVQGSDDNGSNYTDCGNGDHDDDANDVIDNNIVACDTEDNIKAQVDMRRDRVDESSDADCDVDRRENSSDGADREHCDDKAVAHVRTDDVPRLLVELQTGAEQENVSETDADKSDKQVTAESDNVQEIESIKYTRSGRRY